MENGGGWEGGTIVCKTLNAAVFPEKRFPNLKPTFSQLSKQTQAVHNL